MFRSYVLSLAFILQFFIAHPPASAQIPNPGFESWSGGAPVSWYTSNNPEAYPSSVNILQTDTSHGGSYAVRGEVLPEEFMGKMYLHNPQIFSGDIYNDLRGFPVSTRPKQLRGYWKWSAVGAPLLGVTVYLFKGENVIATGGTNRFAPAADTAYRPFLAPISYFNDDTPDTAYISIGISFGDAGSVFFLDDLSFSYLEVVKPAYNDIVIAGERDTIEWSLATGELDILYSINNGNTYTSIVSNYPADSGRYYWDVPEDLLSTKAKIKIVSSSDPDDNAESRKFYIKPWQLTRINGSGNFELFEPAAHGWSFSNSEVNMWPQSWWEQFDYDLGTDPYTGTVYPLNPWFSVIDPDRFPDWPLFVDAFGVDQCYLGSSTPPTTYSSVAVTRWVVISPDPWGGSCYGFAVSNLLGFYHKASLLGRFPGVGDFTNLFPLVLTADNRKVINHYFLHQYGEPFKRILDLRQTIFNAGSTLHGLKDMLALPDGDGRVLVFQNNNGSGGHAVTPYKLERIGSTPTFRLRVSDNNAPGSTNQIITYDSSAGTWTDGTGLGWGTGIYGSGLELISEEHFQTPQFPSDGNFSMGKAAAFNRDSSVMEIFNTPRSAITIRAGSGDSLGYADSTAFNTLNAGYPLIPLTGSNHPPIGYVVPSGEFSVELRELAGPTGYLCFMHPSLVYTYLRDDFTGAQRDRLTYSDGVGVMNPDAGTKTVRLETIIPVDSTERIFTLSALAMSPGDSLFVREINHADLIMKNFGGATQYDLEVRFATGAGVGRFFHASLPIGAGTSHQVVPDWADVESGPMKILIDAGNDGSIDDSMFVTNQLTEVEDRIASGIPAAYSLGQNYPNPFNPATTISFDLPELSIVSLKVYNLVGEEIATLADGVRQAGTYRVTFDGSDLPSGVYIYRLTAGTFNAGGKMVLLK